MALKSFIQGQRVYTVTETAKRLGVTDRWIYRLIQWDKIPVVRDGRRVYITEETVEEYTAMQPPPLTERVKTLRDSGQTFAQIGRRLNISETYAHRLYTGKRNPQRSNIKRS